MLCQTCQKIFRDSCPHKTTKHHSYIHQLEQAAFEACLICRVLWYTISDRTPTSTKEALEAPLIEEEVALKPISQHSIKHRSTRSRDNIHNISELSLVIDKNGVSNNGGRLLMFCLLPMKSMTTPGLHIMALTSLQKPAASLKPNSHLILTVGARA